MGGTPFGLLLLWVIQENAIDAMCQQSVTVELVVGPSMKALKSSPVIFFLQQQIFGWFGTVTDRPELLSGCPPRHRRGGQPDSLGWSLLAALLSGDSPPGP